jgi:DNA-binding NarL/FixJ family response regulator
MNQERKTEFLQEIALRLYRGHSYLKIAKDLNYSYSAVKKYVNYIYKSCDVHSKIALRIYIDSHFSEKFINENQIKKTVTLYI